jgi:hypothetical protein
MTECTYNSSLADSSNASLDEARNEGAFSDRALSMIPESPMSIECSVKPRFGRNSADHPARQLQLLNENEALNIDTIVHADGFSRISSPKGLVTAIFRQQM